MITAIVGGISYPLETIAKLVAHDGWGDSPRHIISDRSSLQHGDTYIDYRLDPRKGQFVFRLPLTSLDAMYAARRTLLGIFAPQNRISILFVLPYGNRQIDCVALPTEMPWEANAWAAQRIGVTLYCPDPTFYDPDGRAVSFSLGGGGDAGVIPMLVPEKVGASVLNAIGTVSYTGGADVFPDLIRVTGPITDYVMTANITGDVLDFAGVAIAAGHYVDIDPRFGHATVKLDGVTAHPEYLTATSDLATFRIVAATDGSGLRANSFTVTGSDVTESTAVTMSFFDRFTGI